MNFVNCHRLLVLFMYCVVPLLVTVNGQPTTGDDIDTETVNELIDIVAELRAEQVKSANAIAILKSQLQNKGKAKYG